MPRNIDIFNELVGLIFADLYEIMPNRRHLESKDFAARMDFPTECHPKSIELIRTDPTFRDEESDFHAVFFATIEFLARNGLISVPAFDAKSLGGGTTVAPESKWFIAHNVTLTLPTLVILGSVPNKLDISPGDRLLELGKEAAAEARRVAIGEVIGSVFGGFFKSFYFFGG